MAETISDIVGQARAISEQDMAAAASLLDGVLREQPDNREVRLLQYDLALRRADFPGAETAMDAALAHDPDAADLLSRRATPRFHLGRLAEARDDLVTAMAREPSRTRAIRLGHLHHALGAPNLAIDLFRRALAYGAGETEGQRAQVWALLMRALRDLGRTADADDAATACLRLHRSKPISVASSVERITNQFDFWGFDAFRKKDGLARALSSVPQNIAPRHPATYLLPGDAGRLAKDAAAGRSGPVWIVKPPDLFGGQGMRMIEDPDVLLTDEPLIVQHYIDRPLLVNGCKQHLRCYILITEVDPPRTWFCRDGLVRFAPAPFVREPGWLDRTDMHITNTALHAGHPGIRINQDKSVENDGSIWGLGAFLAHVAPDEARRAVLWRDLEDTARRLVDVLDRSGLFEGQKATGRAYRPKLIGLDIMLDEDLKPWLIEIQRDPGQTGAGPVNTINARVYDAMFRMTVSRTGKGDAPSILARERAAEDSNSGPFTRL